MSIPTRRSTTPGFKSLGDHARDDGGVAHSMW